MTIELQWEKLENLVNPDFRKTGIVINHSISFSIFMFGDSTWMIHADLYTREYMYIPKRTRIRIWISERWVSPTCFFFPVQNRTWHFRYFLRCLAPKKGIKKHLDEGTDCTELVKSRDPINNKWHLTSYGSYQITAIRLQSCADKTIRLPQLQNILSFSAWRPCFQSC